MVGGRVELEVAHGGERLVGGALGTEYPLDGVQRPIGIGPGKDESPPGHAEGDAQCGLVGAVATDVADSDADRAVLELDGVEEVAAEQGPSATGLVPDGPVEAGVADDRAGHQAPFHAGALGLEQEGLAQLAGRLLALAPGDGVADRPGQRLVVDPSLDEVVLGPEQDRLGRRRRGRSSRSGPPTAAPTGVHDRSYGVESGHVGKSEVDQDAVGTAIELGQSVGQIPAPDELVAATGQLEQLPDEEGVAGVVLDQDDPQGGDGRDARRVAALGTPARRRWESSRWGSTSSDIAPTVRIEGVATHG